MKYIISILITLAFSISSLFSQVDRPSAIKGQVYGENFKEKKLTDIAKIPAKVKSDKKKKMQVKGVVTEVCEKKGCWMNVKIDDDKSLFIKMKDYAFFVPMDMIGKTVLLDGVAYKEITSVEELRHYAEDAKKSQEEINAITEPQVNYRFTADGIKVLD